MVMIPTVKWAQRSNSVYLTIDVQDAKDPQIELDNTEDGKYGHLVFKAEASGGAEHQQYELDLTLFAAVNKETSKISTSPRSVFLVIEKAEPESWPRLTKDSSKHLSHIKVDWDKWVDSDDEEGDGFDPSSMGDLSSLMGGMGGMGGMPGMGGMGGLGGMGGMDLNALGGAGGMGGGGMDFSGLDDADAGDAAGGVEGGNADDSDDEDLPELEA